MSLKIKLVHCGNVNLVNRNDKLQKNVFFIPVGLFSLANELDKNDFDVEMVHLDINSYLELEEIFKFDEIDAIGFDCHWANQSLNVMNTAEYIKQNFPDIFVFLGGFTASLFAKEIISDFKYIDAIIRGDGEKPLIKLCQSLSSKKDNEHSNVPFQEIDNLAWRNAEGETVMNKITYVTTAEEMEKFEFANLDLLRNWEAYRDFSKFYTNFQSFYSYKQFLLCIGRGCVYNCTFCGGNSKSQKLMNNRHGQILRSVNSVVATMEKAIAYGFEFFYSSFDTDETDKWYIDLFKELKKRGIRINFGYNCWRLPSKKLVDAISESCNEALLELSPESGSENLRHSNKDRRLSYSNQELEDLLDYVKQKNNIKVQLWFGYFLPFETEESIHTTFSYISKLQFKYDDIIEVIYDNFSTDPGSLFFYEPDKYDIDIPVSNFKGYLKSISDNYVTSEGAAPDLTLFRPKGLSRDFASKLAAKIRLFNYLYLFYKKSCYCLQKFNSDDFNMFSESLRKLDVEKQLNKDFTMLHIKSFLFDIANQKENIPPYFYQLLNDEYDAAIKLKQLQSSQFFNKKEDFEDVDEIGHSNPIDSSDDIFVI